MGNRSISREQIKQQIKKVVYNSHRSQERPPPSRHDSQAQESLIYTNEDTSGSNLRNSLTPKNFSHPKKQPSN
jgi:hypothetical protein